MRGKADIIMGWLELLFVAEAVEELRPEGVLNVRSYQKRTFSPASD